MPSPQSPKAVFEPAKLGKIAKKHCEALHNLRGAQKELEERYASAHDAALALVLSLLTGEPLLFVGPPGTAKTQMIHDICRFMGINLDSKGDEKTGGNRNSKNRESYFEYLLTEFTEPAELFGYFNLPKLMDQKNPQLERETAGTMQVARVVYLDEVFNGSSAILNSLLTFMQEKRFYDRGQRNTMQWEAVFASTNDVPDRRELRAIFDRFALRCYVSNIEPEQKDLDVLVKRGWQVTYGKPAGFRFDDKTLTDLGQLRDEIRAEDLEPDLEGMGFANRFCTLVGYCRLNGLSDMSNRRVIRMLHVMLMHAMYRSVDPSSQHVPDEINLGDQELLLLKYFVDGPDTTGVLDNMIDETKKRRG